MNTPKRHFIISMAGALAAALITMTALLYMASAHPVPIKDRSASPGFGWSWDFDYRRALAEPHLKADSPQNHHPELPAGQLLLPIDQPVSVSDLQITYRGMTGSGRFRVDVVLAGDSTYSYPHELSESGSRNGFSLAGERFVLLSINDYVLRLKHLTG